jgi:hypothetical protein
MATKKRIKSDPTFLAAMAQVKPALAAWRGERPHRQPIPPALWKQMVPLAQRYGLNPIAQALKVNYYSLKRHVDASAALAAEPSSRVRGEAGFVEVPVSGWPNGAPWIIELEDRAGCKLTLRTASCESVMAMSVAQGLWRQRT